MQNQLGWFQKIFKRHYQNLEHFNIANLVNTRIAKIIKYQPHEGSNHLLSAKSIKREKEKGVLASLACKFQHLNVS